VDSIDPLDRKRLLSLEYLVSTMLIFQATEPRDVIYALLALTRDAAPHVKYTIRDRSSLAMFRLPNKSVSQSSVEDIYELTD
jgi:hypothetical protein